MTGSRLSVIVGGRLAAEPGHGGLPWIVLQYVLGLERLGHHVPLIEPADGPLEGSPGAARFAELVDEFELGSRAALLETGSHHTVGTGRRVLADACRNADVLLDISGVLAAEPLVAEIPCRAYLDLDPGFTQLWDEAEGLDVGLGGHTHFLTVGLGVGTLGCPVPTADRRWLPTCPPVVLDHWSVASGPGAGLTTIANWRGYGSIEWHGVHYGQKAHSWRELVELPRLTETPIRAALAIHPGETEDLAALRAHGWELLDPAEVAGTPAAYRDFIRASRAELAIAKSGYVNARCGWFSDRSACYLASGRPVLAQDTGLAGHLPTGEGLLTFTGVDGALAGIEALESDYDRHRRAARAIAEEHLDSDRVLRSLLDRLGGSAP